MALKDGALYRSYMAFADITNTAMEEAKPVAKGLLSNLSEKIGNMTKQDWGIVIAIAVLGYLAWTYDWEDEDDDDDDTPSQPSNTGVKKIVHITEYHGVENANRA